MTKGYGFSVDDIDWSCPSDLEPYNKAYKLQLQQQDNQLHTMGMYALSAISTAIEHAIAGKSAKSEYIKEPFLSNAFENDGLTEEEILNKEIRRAILAEETWMSETEQKGFPKTIIKK